MRLQTIEVFKYNELSNSAQQNARQWFSSSGYSWTDEGIDSVKAFCKHYGASITDCSLSPYSYSYIDTNIENHHLRGVTLKQVEKEKDLMPTGYCIDCDLFVTMYEAMRDNGGNALQAFKDAIEAAMKAMITDMEYQDSDEHIAEVMEANDYEFTESGVLV